VPTVACDASYFAGERVELVHHGVDGVLQFRISPFTSTVILRERSPLATAGGNFGDVADLSSKVSRHRVHGVGEILPGSGDAGHVGLTA